MKQQKTRLTYSNTNGIIEERPAPEALIVCIIQVATCLSLACHAFQRPDAPSTTPTINTAKENKRQIRTLPKN